MDDDDIAIRIDGLDGIDVHPHTVAFQSMRQLLGLIEDAIAEQACADGAELRSAASVHLVEVRDECALYRFRLAVPALLAMASLARAVNHLRFDELAPKARACLVQASEFVSRNAWAMEVGGNEKHRIRSMRISPDRPVPPAATRQLRGTKGLVARVVAVGSPRYTRPCAWVSPVGLPGNLQVTGEEEIIRTLATHLYRTVRLRGVATWTQQDGSSDWDLDGLHVEDCEAFRGADPVRALHFAREALGGLAETLDPNEVQNARRGEDEG